MDILTLQDKLDSTIKYLKGRDSYTFSFHDVEDGIVITIYNGVVSDGWNAKILIEDEIYVKMNFGTGDDWQQTETVSGIANFCADMAYLIKSIRKITGAK